ncbi:MAG: alpha/beta hydrolase [Acidimicrobiales bacterium]
MSWRPAAALLTCLALGLGACGDDDDDEAAALTTTSSTGGDASPAPTTAPAGRPFEPAPIEWESCGDHDCAELVVPLDYADPSGPTITIALRRIPASEPDQRIGALLTNPGGPGASGIEFVRSGSPFESEVYQRFDVIGFDPRGVGQSTGLQCGGELVDEFQALDSDPDSPAEQGELDARAQAIAEDCADQDGDLLAHMGTADVVRDMDTIRRALGEQTISYVGFSYGTLLGERYAEMFPSGARAIVLDGVVDPSHDFREFLTGQTVAIERTLNEVFEACSSSTPECPGIGGAAAYDEISSEVEKAPLPAGSNELGPGDLATAAIYVTYSASLWPALYGALADGLEGDGSSLYDLAELYRSFGGFTSYVAVECVDSPHPVGSDEFQVFAAELEAISPRFGAAIANELLPCAFWPAAAGTDPQPVTAKGAPPILVIGNTGDAATPYEQAERVAETLSNAVLLTYEGEGHTSIGSSQCVDDATTRYLIDLELPDPGTVC